MRKKVVIIGAGGHAKVIADIIIKSGDEVLAILDDNEKIIGSQIINELNIKVSGKVADCINYKNAEFVIAIGSNKIRKDISQKYDLKYYTAIHPSATIGLDAKIGEGTVVMPGAIINSGAVIGKHCIINTSSVIEHDCKLEDFVHISPNSTLAGKVTIGECTQIGVGACVKNNIVIGENSLIGAGAVVVKDILEPGTYIGIPARKMIK